VSRSRTSGRPGRSNTIAESGSQISSRSILVPVNPLLLQAGIIAPLMFFFATARLRRKMERGGAAGLSTLTREMVVDHLQRITLAQLEGKL